MAMELISRHFGVTLSSVTMSDALVMIFYFFLAPTANWPLPTFWCVVSNGESLWDSIGASGFGFLSRCSRDFLSQVSKHLGHGLWSFGVGFPVCWSLGVGFLGC